MVTGICSTGRHGGPSGMTDDEWTHDKGVNLVLRPEGCYLYAMGSVGPGAFIGHGRPTFLAVPFTTDQLGQAVVSVRDSSLGRHVQDHLDEVGGPGNLMLKMARVRSVRAFQRDARQYSLWDNPGGLRFFEWVPDASGRHGKDDLVPTEGEILSRSLLSAPRELGDKLMTLTHRSVGD